MLAPIRYSLFFMLISLSFLSCQKDQDLKDNATEVAKPDSISSVKFASSPGNVLALSGNLKIFIGDSTYVFNAKDDSIAFINITLDNKNYFGITAINKAHTLSFGISSPGYAATAINSPIAGSQFLSYASDKPLAQVNLTQTATNNPDQGNLTLSKYAQDSVLARGTFYTFLTRDSQPNAKPVKVTGIFNLKIK